MSMPVNATHYREKNQAWYQLCESGWKFWNCSTWVPTTVPASTLIGEIELGKMRLVSEVSKSDESTGKITALSILKEAGNCIDNRASERDTKSERSMRRTVEAFNVMFDKDLTETQGWQFMELLKMARSQGGDFRLDDFVDGSSYAALAGECDANKNS